MNQRGSSVRHWRWVVVGLVCLGLGCGPVQAESSEPPKLTPRAQAERLAEERGFDLRQATLEEPPGGKGDRHQLHYNGVPAWGLEAKTAHGETHFSPVRLAPGVHVETQPQVTQEEAVAAALARLEDASARLTGARHHPAQRRAPRAGGDGLHAHLPAGAGHR